MYGYLSFVFNLTTSQPITRGGGDNHESADRRCRREKHKIKKNQMVGRGAAPNRVRE